MSDDVTIASAAIVSVGLFQLALGLFLGWLRWGRRRRDVRPSFTEMALAPVTDDGRARREADAAARDEARRILKDRLIIRVKREQLARIDAQNEVPPGLAELVATCGVEVVEATPWDWTVIQGRLDAECVAHALEHQESVLAHYRKPENDAALRAGAPVRKVGDDTNG